VFWTPRNGGHWMVLKYEAVFGVLRDPKVFSSALIAPARKAAAAAFMPHDAQRAISMTPIFMDPPDHTRYRLPLQRAFSPKTMTALKGDVEALAHQLVDAVIDQGGCDFFSAIAEQLPVRVFLRMMGLPEDRLAEYRALVREIFAPAGDDPMVQVRRMRRIVDAMTPVILARREAPQDDLISQLWALEVEDQPMTLELMEDYAALIFLAGLDTVINAMSFGVRHLAQHPELQARLRARPDLIDEAAEELLRRYTFTMTMRRVTTDTELAGASLKAEETVIVYMPAADLDADQFSAPAVFDVEREGKVHLAFGSGPHRCLGSHLARIELQTLYDVLLKRLPEFRLDPAAPVTFQAGMMLTIASLPLRWD
jgi:cytochrome P450